MKSVLLSQDDVSHADQFDNQAGEGTDRSTTEPATIAQLLRQDFDMSVDEALEGLQGVQQVLHQFEATFFSVPISTLTPEARLKVRRTSHHCTRLIAEVQQLLLPFSQDQTFISLEAQPVSVKENINI
jgi:hypothetical protein